MNRPRTILGWTVTGGAIIAAIIAVIALVLFGLYQFRDTPGARSVDDAVDEFRANSPAETGIVEVGIPPAGVYSAAAQGQSSINFPPASQSWGQTLPVTITHLGDDCWTLAIDFNTAYRQTWTQCVVDGQLVERGSVTVTRWDFGITTVSNTATYDCEPAGVLIPRAQSIGSASAYTCEGTTDTVDGTTTSEATYEFVSIETIPIENSDVATYHFIQTEILTGAQRGTTKTDYWFSTSDFLLIRMSRNLEIHTDSPVGDVVLLESGSEQLSSITPIR